MYTLATKARVIIMSPFTLSRAALIVLIRSPRPRCLQSVTLKAPPSIEGHDNPHGVYVQQRKIIAKASNGDKGIVKLGR
jgi:hypothetical protein